jgi:hypothetical protein
MDAVLLIVRSSYLEFWVSLVAGGALGLLGGIAWGASGKSGTHLVVLSIPMSIAGMLSAAIVLVGSVSVSGLLAEITQRAADKVGYILLYPSSWVGLFAAGTALVYLLAWQLLGWLALRKVSYASTNRPLSWDISGWVNGLMPVLLVILILLLNDMFQMKNPWMVVLSLCLSDLAGFPALQTIWKLRTLPRPAEHASISAH